MSGSPADQPSARSPAQPPAQPPAQRPAIALSPMPGSREYAKLQMQIMKDTLSNMAEPSPGETDRHPLVRQVLEQWTQMILYGEDQIAKFGPRVNPELLRKTVQLQFNRTLIYWRMFRFMELPPEIISNILHLVVWSTGHPSEGVKQRLRLTWVCRAWRLLMIQDPTIWNAIWFHDPPPYERSWEWFRRAGSASLDIRLNEVDPKWTKVQDNHKFTAQQMSDILDRLFTKLPQIRMLVVIVDNWPPAMTVVQKLQTAGIAGIPINIERLEVHRAGTPYVWIGPGFDTQGHRDPAVLFGGHTHHLKYLCLSGIHIDFNDTPLSNLSTLDLRNIAMDASPTLRRFREILRNCPRLDKLTLDGCGPQPEAKPFDHVPIDLLHLKTLVIGSFSLPYACYAVSQINAPRLRDLTLMSLTGANYIPLIKLLTPKFKEVRILTLYSVHVTMDPLGKKTFVRWLESMPEVGYARFARMKLAVLEMFAENPMDHRSSFEGGSSLEGVTHARPILCPKFQCMEVQALPATTIAEFCRFRKEIGLPMKKIYLNTPWAESLTPDQLRMLQKEATIFIAPLGANTQEENKLLSEGWQG
ncbi:hypothetical protein BDN67DRAFT_12872 [Paxillus ammoniavirescens]|nr:hypothetical protein BDN67DRAFT_12872 [Paxillus ammoniavirescens]